MTQTQPYAHSLSTFVRSKGLSRGRKIGDPRGTLQSIPSELTEGVGTLQSASQFYKPKKRDHEGFGADDMLTLAIEEGFNLDPDLNDGDFLALVAEDYRASRGGHGRRTYSSAQEWTIDETEAYEGYRQMAIERAIERAELSYQQWTLTAAYFVKHKPGSENSGQAIARAHSARLAYERLCDLLGGAS